MIVKRILLTGASGYLGQHILHRWMKGEGLVNDDDDDDKYQYEITALYHRMDGFEESVETKQQQLIKQREEDNNYVNFNYVSVKVISLDISSKEDIVKKLATKNNNNNNYFDICVHTAAMSSPRACEDNPQKAKDINIPILLLQHLSNVPMIILSTDQVYDGCIKKNSSKTTNNDDDYYLYNEDNDQPNPLNIYGQTKYELEQYFMKNDDQQKQKQHNSSAIILRSSIILGPRAPICSNAHDTFLHFIETRKEIDTTYYTNEYRTVVSLDYVCNIITYFVMKQLTTTTTTIKQQRNNNNNNNNDEEEETTTTKATVEVYNMGGPVRVNRFDIATTVFQYFGWYDKYKNHILETKQTSTTVPLDISMDSTKLINATGIVHEPKTLMGIVESTFSY